MCYGIRKEIKGQDGKKELSISHQTSNIRFVLIGTFAISRTFWTFANVYTRVISRPLCEILIENRENLLKFAWWKSKKFAKISPIRDSLSPRKLLPSFIFEIDCVWSSARERSPRRYSSRYDHTDEISSKHAGTIIYDRKANDHHGKAKDHHGKAKDHHGKDNHNHRNAGVWSQLYVW